MAIDEVMRAGPAHSRARVIVAATIGNMLECYDFVIYAAFAIPIAKSFFPTSDDRVSLLVSFITFGLGFVARPFGAVVLGGYADRHGRSKAMGLTILLMALGTSMIALCPGYQRIGLLAPAAVLLARLVQGFSAGGAIGGTISMLVENAPPGRRGLYASFQQLSQGAQIMLAGLVPLALTLVLPPEAISDWGWRLAFAGGLLIVPVGFYIRSPRWASRPAQPCNRHWPAVLLAEHPLRDVDVMRVPSQSFARPSIRTTSETCSGPVPRMYGHVGGLPLPKVPIEMCRRVGSGKRASLLILAQHDGYPPHAADASSPHQFGCQAKAQSLPLPGANLHDARRLFSTTSISVFLRRS